MLINRLFQREKKWLLICKPTEDGFDVNDFHRLYNNRGTTLTLIQIRNYLHMKKHDSIFDGYTTKPWPSQHDRITRFKLQSKDETAVSHYSTTGPVFGLDDIYICNRAYENNFSYSNNKNDVSK
ncbi:unnamed protein product [Rotaria sordida]|uniref:TLDc domain-containing protein n=1 Tax=Rotaria sordida TaxID=392033 RepID=A0A814C7Q2_9BILA|nr:unnamed protein product [Rotaria sordida]CAF3749893.1 unnamed protein product [Rotaria sordida]